MSRKGRAKVKSGCKTCKVRKVKCDEGRPACQRCLSTGRICDGYGIWGGGSQALTAKAKHMHMHIPLSNPATAFTSLNPHEKLYFDWFKCRTSTKISATFSSGFWSTLVFQAGSKEPAVLHALLALSSAHKKGVVEMGIHRNSLEAEAMNQQEQFTLQQYVKAIGHLQPHFSARDRASCRVALITCVVFVCLEFFRGHFATAQIHLQNGLDILAHMQGLADAKSGILALKPCQEATDAWIVEALSRLHIQVELFRHLYYHSCVILQPAPYPQTTPPDHFDSLNDAWKGLELVYNQIFHLTHRARQQRVTATEHMSQQLLTTRLAQWDSMFQDFLNTHSCGPNRDMERAYQVVRIQYAMINIMADTCIHNNEMVYDACTDKFILLIKELTGLWEVSTYDHDLEDEMPLHIMATCMPRSIVDIGWLPALYFTAVKCRVHRIRIEALKLLRTSPHREGIWDAHVAACVAKKVIELEEGDFYQGADLGDDFPLNSSIRDRDLQLPLLPEYLRLSEIETELSGAPMNKILLYGKREQDGINRRVLLSEYSVNEQTWKDT